MNGLFKWTCLVVAAAFLGFVAWVLNDLRLQVRQMEPAVQAISRDVPVILDKARKATDALGNDLPDVMAKARSAADSTAEAAQELRELNAALGKVNVQRDPALMDYAASALAAVEQSGAKVGRKPPAGDGRIQNAVPAREWVANARRLVGVRTLLAGSRADLMKRLTTTASGSPWVMEVAGKVVPMLDWLKENHPETKKLFE